MRDVLHSACADEWEKMTGACVTAKTSRIVCADVCDKSTIIPSRFISRTTAWKARKKMERPRKRGKERGPGKLRQVSCLIYLPKWRKSAVSRKLGDMFQGRRVGPRGIARVRQRQVSHAQVVKNAQHGEGVADRVAAFDSNQSRNTIVVVRFQNFWGGGKKWEWNIKHSGK